MESVKDRAVHLPSGSPPLPQEPVPQKPAGKPGCCKGKKPAAAPAKDCAAAAAKPAGCGTAPQAKAPAPDAPACPRGDAKPASSFPGRGKAQGNPAHLPPPLAATVVERSVDLPQYRHPFVEGCTCGSGVIGCCPCTMGLAEQGALGAGSGAHAGAAAHGPLMAGVGILGGVGLYLGVRAITTNREASGRVIRAQGHNAERLLALRHRQHRMAAGGAPLASGALVAKQTVAAQRRAHALGESLADRRFNFWVPGLVQVVGSAFMILAAVQHLTHWLATSPGFAGLATGVLAGYAGLYAGRVLWRAAKAWGDFRAARAAALAAPEDPYRAEVKAHAARELRQRGWLGLAWAALAGTSGALLVLPALGVGVGAALGWATVAAQVAAVATSLRWPAPVHTPSTPRLDEAFEAAATTEPALRQAWLSACTGQIDHVRSFSGVLLAGPGWAEKKRRLDRKLEPWTTPQCGPKAYASVAQAFVAQVRNTGNWPAGTEAAVATYLGHEAAWLTELERVHAARLATLAPELAAAESLPAYVAAAVAEGAQEAEASHARVVARLASVEQLRATWSDLAGRKGLGPTEQAARQTAMVDTLVALGLLGEVAGDLIERHPAWFYAAPSPGRLAFGHVVLRPEHAAAFAAAVGPKLAYGFVRCLFNPNRLEAERAELLAAGAKFAPGDQAGLAPLAQAGPGKTARADEAAASFAGCSSCVA